MASKTASYSVEALAPGMSVFVSANAGAGKTSLLVNRVLSLLLHGVPPDKILCLTFTNAAAAEMMSRVQGALGEWVMLDEAKLADTLGGLLGSEPDRRRIDFARSLFATVLEAGQGMRIQTIHGFCQSLLRRFPLEAGVAPQFVLIDGRTEQELLQEARLRLLGKAQQGADGSIRGSIGYLVRKYGESGFNELLKELVKHKRKLMKLFYHYGQHEELSRKLWSVLGLKPGIAFEALVEEHFRYDENTLVALRRIAGILSQGIKKDKQTAEGLALWLEKPGAGGNVAAYVASYMTKEGKMRDSLYGVKTLADPALIEQLMLEKRRVEEFDKACKAHAIATDSVQLLAMGEEFLALYEALKSARGALDYDDLILTAGNLLRREGLSSWVLFKLDGGIDHILVDEAQDTSPEQWAIIDALTREFFSGEGRSASERSLFIVGDEKQSIYSFQGADVQALGGMQRYFSERIRDAALNVQTLSLTHSYRSTPEVLAAVDAVFARPQAREGLLFDDGALTHGVTRLDAKGLVELWPLVEVDDDTPVSVSTLLARQVADQIAGWIGRHRILEAKNRPVKPGDIMVLVRSRTDFVDSLTRALKRRNIPVSGIDRMMLGDNLAVQDLIALGQVLLLPEDDLTLAALLKSPIFGMDEENLYRLAQGRDDASLWQRLRNFAKQEPVFTEAYDLLSGLRSMADYVRPYELYAHVLDTLGARRRITGRMGEEYADPIDEFLTQALLYERSHTPGLQGFLHWLTTSDSEIKRDMEQVENAVRIMTVHGAKGLQAPIVILPDTISKPQERQKFLWHGDKDAPLPLVSTAAKRDDPVCAALRAQRDAAAMAEYRRLLYVAMTRAEDELYIMGAQSRGAASDGNWYHLVREGLEPLASRFETAAGEGLRIGNEPRYGKAVPQAVNPLSGAGEVMNFGFLFNPPPAEPVPPRPLSPSRLNESEPAAASPLAQTEVFERGSLIHRLLQYLPSAAGERRGELAQSIAAGYVSLPPQTRSQCIEECMRILRDPAFAFLFAEGTHAEVPVVGNVQIGAEKLFVSGQIDRLCVREDEVWIVDFKSNALPPETASAVGKPYLRQLFLYKRLLEQIYPGRRVYCALLWTATAALMPIDEALLDESLLSTYILPIP